MRIRVVVVLSLVLAATVISCGILPAPSSGQSWYMDQDARNIKQMKGSFTLAGVKVDRAGGWDSLQSELEGLAPLYFWEQGYYLKADGEEADYAAGIHVREREYISHWKTRRSISVEVRIWDLGNYPSPQDITVIEQTLPLAAGREVSTGDSSLSSSRTAGRMLARAVKKAVRRLDRTSR